MTAHVVCLETKQQDDVNRSFLHQSCNHWYSTMMEEYELDSMQLMGEEKGLDDTRY